MFRFQYNAEGVWIHPDAALGQGGHQDPGEGSQSGAGTGQLYSVLRIRKEPHNFLFPGSGSVSWYLDPVKDRDSKNKTENVLERADPDPYFYETDPNCERSKSSLVFLCCHLPTWLYCILTHPVTSAWLASLGSSRQEKEKFVSSFMGIHFYTSHVIELIKN